MDNKPQKINCHFISNTHWDREWRFSARRTQYMLGYMLDMLTDILDKYPECRFRTTLRHIPRRKSL